MSNRGKNPNSLKNLELGRRPGKGRGQTPNSVGPTWKELIEKFGQIEPTAEVCEAAGLTKKALKEMGLKRPTWKALVVARAFRETNNPSIFKELMQRSEPAPNEVIIRHDWREMARAAGLEETEVLAEAERIIHESNYATGDHESDEAEG